MVLPSVPAAVRKQGGKGYVPSFIPPGMAAAMAGEKPGEKPERKEEASGVEVLRERGPDKAAGSACRPSFEPACSHVEGVGPSSGLVMGRPAIEGGTEAG